MWAIAEGTDAKDDEDDDEEDDFDGGEDGDENDYDEDDEDDEDFYEDDEDGFEPMDGVVVKPPEQSSEPASSLVFPPPPKEDPKYRWVIRHGPDDYKTGKDYGVRPPMVIHPRFYPALDTFVNHLRQHLKPKGTQLFCGKHGAPLTGPAVYRVVTSTTYRHTGKRTNPHLIRDMIITHLRGTDASERELEALAIYMGHSLAMQKGTYDRRTKEEKVAPAIDLLDSVNSRWMGTK